MKLVAKKNLKFCLMGAGFHLCSFAEMLCARGFPKPVIVTYPREQHKRDEVLLTDSRVYKSVFETVENLSLELLILEDMNNEDAIQALKDKGCNCVFSLSWRYRIKHNFIDAFDGRVFNIHPSLLPKERGSGTFSYRIMNKSEEISATIHWVNPYFDAGAIVIQRQVAIHERNPKPIDFLVATNNLYIQLLQDFLELLEAGQSLPSTPQQEQYNSYLPLLNTEINGAIDWAWNVDEIERFIRAFASPYPGAFTYCDQQKIAILDAATVSSEIEYHPFLLGRIVSCRADSTVLVIARGGLLHVKEIAIDHTPMKPLKVLKHTSILHTPGNVLERARTSVMLAKHMPVPSRK